MILRPIHNFKLNRSQLPVAEKNVIDSLIFDMMNVAYKVIELKLTSDDHFIQFSLKSGKVLQFIVDIDDDSLYVMLYDGNNSN